MPTGVLALVGSGEYTPKMLEIEKTLIQSGIDSGKTGPYVQFATAAGLESESRLNYWKELGATQAEKLGVASKFIEVFNRKDAEDSRWLKEIEGASLIYFSGGNPKHLADTLRGTDLWEKIVNEFRTGSSLAGCSAGAMFMAQKIAFPIHFKNMEDGLNLIPNLVVLPHFDRYFSRIPTFMQKFIFQDDKAETVIGIDENTALIYDKNSWRVEGSGAVHIVAGAQKESFSINQRIESGIISKPSY